MRSRHASASETETGPDTSKAARSLRHHAACRLPARRPFLLKVSTATVYKLAHSGALPFVRVLGSLRFRLSDVDAYLERSAGIDCL